MTVTEGYDLKYSIATGPGEEIIEIIRVGRHEDLFIRQNTVLASIRR